jgi:hypothetical protein
MKTAVRGRTLIAVLMLLCLLALAAALVPPVTGADDPQEPQLAGDVDGFFLRNEVKSLQGTRVRVPSGKPGVLQWLEPDGSITLGLLQSPSIADGAVTSPKIAPGAVGPSQLETNPNSVGTMTNGGITQSGNGINFVPLQSGKHMVWIGPTVTDPNSLLHLGRNDRGDGTLTINGGSGDDKVTIGTTPGGAGFFEISGPSGNKIGGFGTTAESNGSVVVGRNSDGQFRAAMQVDAQGRGVVAADVGILTQAVANVLTFATATGTTLRVTGTKTFQIDHPLDPANKYLVHSCVESDQRANIYSGTITTNARGEATVLLPDYFEALNRDFRYQLTCIGQFAQAIVAQEIRNNRFTIKTDRPRVKVSWQVTGERQDAYAKAHPMEVEEYKQGDERGRYLHPEQYGRPREEGIQYQAPLAWRHSGGTLARGR